MSDYKINVESLKEMRKSADNTLVLAGYDCLKSVGKTITVYLDEDVYIDVYGELAEKHGKHISLNYQHDHKFFEAIVQSLVTTIIGEFIYFDFKLVAPVNLNIGIDIYDFDTMLSQISEKTMPFDTLSAVVEERENKDAGAKYLEFSFAKFFYRHNGAVNDEIYIFIRGIETQY